MGSDAEGDGTRANPWATVLKANSLDLESGDRLLFEGGEVFSSAPLEVGPEDAGTEKAPVVVTSYGSGRAVFDASESDRRGLYIVNAGGLHLKNLAVQGTGRLDASAHGIELRSDARGAGPLRHVRIVNVEVSGFAGGIGLFMWAGRGPAGWRDVRVTGSAFHGNRDGMQTWAAERGAIQNLYVGRCSFYENHGHPDPPGRTPTGSGIVLGMVRNGTIEHSVAYENGRLHGRDVSRPFNGPVGIWAYESAGITIQHNESYGNRTASEKDGGGFDLDGGMTNSVLQYNYSHDNEGAGYGLFQYRGASTWENNVVRYNISENDRRGGLHVWDGRGDMSGAKVYNNDFYADAKAGAPAAFRAASSVQEAFLHNNVFIARGGAALIEVEAQSTGGYLFQGNHYWSPDAPFRIAWGSRGFARLKRWRAATGQETRRGVPVGQEGDPHLAGVRGKGPGGEAHAPTDFKLQPGSPLIGAGLEVGDLLGEHAGSRDYYGNALPRGAYDIGAHEASYEVGSAGERSETNVLENPGFEKGAPGQAPAGWKTWSPGNAYQDADFTERGGAREGRVYARQAKPGGGYTVYTYQVPTGLEEGTYTLSAWVQSSGGQTYATMEVKQYGGPKRYVNLGSTTGWEKRTIAGIRVTEGEATIGFYSAASAGEHIAFDGVRFYRQRPGDSTASSGGGCSGASASGGPASGKRHPGEAGSLRRRPVLEGSYPNPFRRSTVIAYALPKAARVHLAVYDVLGRHMATLVDERQAAGPKRARFDAQRVASGIYFYRLKTDVFGGTRQTGAMHVVQ